MVAEMANALNFIESNVEDLDKGQRIEKNKADLIKAQASLANSRPSIGKLQLEDLDDLQTSLLL